ncbi:hypothetical protein ACFWYW_55100 [Nonomuraea sp. NPDC059023]|uniref:hypothetical protein n=1 Tax=unclassified Nonomuraea TaxID=2593643 RepID=UPI00369AE3F6
MALLVTLIPDVFFWIRSLLAGDDGGTSYVWMSAGSCLGNQIDDLIRYPERMVRLLPLFWYGGAPMIVAAWGGWYLSVRTGRDRLGRVIARSAAVILLLLRLPELLLFTLDGALGRECLDAWGPPAIVSRNAGMDLYSLAPPILVLLAVRPVRRGFVRRGRFARTAVAVLTLMTTLLVVDQAAPPGKVSSERELDCAGFGDGTAHDLTKAEKDFLCRVRGYDSFMDDGIESWAEVSDRVVLAQGHDLCRVAEQHEGDTGAPAVREAPHAALAGALGALCPAVARAQELAGQRGQAEEAAYFAGKEKACAAHPAHRPKIEPVRRHRATMWTEFWTINGWDDGYEGTNPELVRELVGSERGALTIWAADEIGHACVTTESYTRRPPLETKGWREVVEVAYESPTGSLALADGRGTTSPKLTASGPGSYRVRVHLRGRDRVYQIPYPPDAAVELLIMVFPGERKEPAVYR